MRKIQRKVTLERLTEKLSAELGEKIKNTEESIPDLDSDEIGRGIDSILLSAMDTAHIILATKPFGEAEGIISGNHKTDCHFRFTMPKGVQRRHDKIMKRCMRLRKDNKEMRHYSEPIWTDSNMSTREEVFAHDTNDPNNLTGVVTRCTK
eukprot:1054587-Pyramimonas_sp.AAC.1